MPQNRPDFSPLPGSERTLPADAQLIGPCSPSASITVTLYLRPRNQEELQRQFSQLSQPTAHLTPEQFAGRYGADPADLDKLNQFASQHQLQVLETDLARRSVRLSGSVAAMESAFGVQLHDYRHRGSTYRLRQGPVYLPAELQGIVTAVFGLDNRPQAEAHFRLVSPAASQQAFNPTDLARLYNFPTSATGQGETIGIIELGGGYQHSDLNTYFQQLGLSPAPQVTAVSVDGGQNSPTGDPNSADGEVELDIEVAGAIAPGAKQKIFFAPNTDQGFIDAVTSAVHDPDVTLISISWGQAESSFTSQSLDTFNQAFQEAGTMGKTVFAAAGDNGSSDGQSDGKNHVDFPSSSPFAIGCGGTTLQAASGNSSIVSETVWNEESQGLGATGGGVSDYFAKPDYQSQANVPAPQGQTGGRGVPDVAGDADPVTGYNVLIDGAKNVIGGTSAVAPLYAGLFALINELLVKQGKPRAGYVQPALYRNPQAFHDITSGNNGAFSAAPGWDAATGLGSPNGIQIANALTGTQTSALG
ncbi:MAG TPA: S53 family peptidase [Chthoniobacterales bacterium]|nr:S53 family peptidase [Chthoniobacterales bacterium]